MCRFSHVDVLNGMACAGRPTSQDKLHLQGAPWLNFDDVACFLTLTFHSIDLGMFTHTDSRRRPQQ